ncbi:hypothetical protein POTOM_040069 [Populus tomentosa]|uniref:Exonuclease domain-containing protein n=1 Tax=Populus tomentosa TaxID=118781 RepID=A0A8X8CJK7_POPTO|nr:hypothetical protein POTOM_040069 [Populus tomentosa]
MSFPRIPLSRVPSYLHNSNSCFHLLHPPFIPVSKTPSLPTYQTARTYTDFNSQTQAQPPLSLPSLIPSPPVNNPNATHRWKPMCLYHTHGKCTKIDDPVHVERFNHDCSRDFQVSAADFERKRPQDFDFFLVFDLEGKVEILEFPVLIIDAKNMGVVDLFHRFVRPTAMSEERVNEYIYNKYGKFGVDRYDALSAFHVFMISRAIFSLVGVADRSADIVGLASLVSMEMNELVALDVGTVKGLILMLVIRKRKLSVAACDAILDLSTTLIGRNKTREETETKNQNNTGEKEQTTVKKKKQKGACSRDSNREGEKLALANQHISAVVFVIKLQHQAKAERRRTNRRRKERLDKGEENSQPLRHRHRLRSVLVFYVSGGKLIRLTMVTCICSVWHDTALPFNEVLQQFESWLTQHNLWEKTRGGRLNRAAFVTCGNWDVKTQVPHQCSVSKLKLPPYFMEWINLKDVYQNFYNPRNEARGMRTMMSQLKIPMVGSHHLGLDDTKNIARVLLRMLADGAVLPITARRKPESPGSVNFLYKNRI